MLGASPLKVTYHFESVAEEIAYGIARLKKYSKLLSGGVGGLG